MIGLLAGLYDSRQVFGPDLRVFAFIGVVGGFTTFSTFGFETLAMARDQEYLRAASNVILHVGVALPAVWLGYTAIGPR